MQLLHILTLGIALIGVLIIIWGVLTGLRGFLLMEFRRVKGADDCMAIETLRRDLGSYLLLGLEFLIAADIVNTIVKPTIDEIIILGSIVAIRTVLTYSLDKEVSENSQTNTQSKSDRLIDSQG